jgi:hypothetical protein
LHLQFEFGYRTRKKNEPRYRQKTNKPGFIHAVRNAFCLLAVFAYCLLFVFVFVFVFVISNSELRSRRSRWNTVRLFRSWREGSVILYTAQKYEFKFKHIAHEHAAQTQSILHIRGVRAIFAMQPGF